MVKANLKFAGASDPGRVRKNNEDSLHSDPDRGFFLVVDGIGGQAAGEKAAEIAVDRIRTRLERQTGTVEQRIREAITIANNEIVKAARGNPDWQGMACVLTLVVLENGSAVVGHVGDSRLYQIRRGEIRKITHDHSPVGEREDSNELSEAEAMRHPRRNEVFRDVGSEEHSPDDNDFIELRRFPFEPDSALLLCSDGLSDQVASGEIRTVVERHAGDPDAAVRELIAAANAAGGKDNVTVLIVEGERFTAAPAAPVVQPPGGGWLKALAFFAAGLAIAAAAAWFTRAWWAPPPVTISPRVLVVGNGAQFAGITEALAEARAGDTVEVLHGEYREQVRLKSGITLRSRAPQEAILRAAAVSGGPAIVAEDVQNARVAGFRIVGDTLLPLSEGILLVNSQVELDDIAVEGAGIGVEIRGTASPSLHASEIQDCTEHGLLIAGTAAPWISHNAFRRNKSSAITARDGARPVIIGNTFEKNGLELPPDLMAAAKAHNTFLDAPPAPRKNAPRRTQ